MKLVLVRLAVKFKIGNDSKKEIPNNIPIMSENKKETNTLLHVDRYDDSDTKKNTDIIVKLLYEMQEQRVNAEQHPIKIKRGKSGGNISSGQAFLLMIHISISLASIICFFFKK